MSDVATEAKPKALPVVITTLEDALESPTLSKFAEAFAKAQGQMEAAIKDRTNPAFKSKYADFAAIVEAVRKPFAANGLSFIQRPISDQSGVTVVTTLLHVSGEFVRGSFRVPVTANTPQAFGSALTYGRRYGLSSLAGISTEEDDDANHGSGVYVPNGDMRGELKARGATAAKTAKESAKPPPSEPKATTPDKPLTPQARANLLWKRAARVTTLEGFKLWTKKVVGKTRSEDMTPEDADHLEAAFPDFERAGESDVPM